VSERGKGICSNCGCTYMPLRALLVRHAIQTGPEPDPRLWFEPLGAWCDYCWDVVQEALKKRRESMCVLD
jgi:bacterioferritin-associated ferredoxin